MIQGEPNASKISTSYIERVNLTTRMSIRRFGRRTNAHSKSLRHHEAAISLHFFSYNFVRVHQTLGTTPAMAAGIADHVWSSAELVTAALAKKAARSAA